MNAAIGGTGSDLGAFRCGVDVVAHDPDLVFVEFNINDGSPVDDFHKATMEGIVRQLWASRSKPEIVFLYTTSRTLHERRGSHPAVARHYGIPQIDLQPPLLEALKRFDLPGPTPAKLKDKNLDWSQPGQVFMSDSVHPNALGHAIYTQDDRGLPEDSDRRPAVAGASYCRRRWSASSSRRPGSFRPRRRRSRATGRSSRRPSKAVTGRARSTPGVPATPSSLP